MPPVSSSASIRPCLSSHLPAALSPPLLPARYTQTDFTGQLHRSSLQLPPAFLWQVIARFGMLDRAHLDVRTVVWLAENHVQTAAALAQRSNKKITMMTASLFSFSLALSLSSSFSRYLSLALSHALSLSSISVSTTSDSYSSSLLFSSSLLRSPFHSLSALPDPRFSPHLPPSVAMSARTRHLLCV